MVYCDNAGKKGKKELDKILAGAKNNGRARCCRTKNCIQPGLCRRAPLFHGKRECFDYLNCHGQRGLEFRKVI